ncbi:response regulator [Caenispirillum bisanense]|uniref:response regulator n=1 Tax=Caenispirillum bisanense TaxID=414052 RepID=UPI0031D64453
MDDTRKTVLVVEDNALNMKLFEQILRQGGFNPLASLDGSGLVDLVRTARPSCILMDIQLPHISGFDLLKQVRSQDDLRTTPVVAVTAFAPGHDRNRFLDAGFDAFLAKPVSVRVLLSTVGQLSA